MLTNRVRCPLALPILGPMPARACGPCGAAGGSGERLADSLDDLRRVRLDGGGEAVDDLAVAVYQELLKIPLHEPRQQSLLKAGQPGVQRMLVPATDIRLGGERKSHAEVALAELGDFGVGSGLLPGELVAGDAEDREAFLAELVVERLQPGVLRRKAALGGHVYDQYDLAPESAKVRFGAVVEGQRDGMQGCHGWVSSRVWVQRRFTLWFGTGARGYGSAGCRGFWCGYDVPMVWARRWVPRRLSASWRPSPAGLPSPWARSRRAGSRSRRARSRRAR